MPGRTLYRVRFNQTDLWTDYTGSRADTLDIDLYDHWLDQA
jgi:nitrile hydratase